MVNMSRNSSGFNRKSIRRDRSGKTSRLLKIRKRLSKFITMDDKDQASHSNSKSERKLVDRMATTVRVERMHVLEMEIQSRHSERNRGYYE